MPVVTNRLNLVNDLLANPPVPGTLRRLTRQASVDMILCGPTTKTKLRASLAAMGKSDRLSQLEVFIDALVLSTDEKLIEDRKISRIEAKSLEELFDSEGWQAALDHHHGATIPGESRDSFFGRSFGNLISANPKEVKVLDRYFLTKTLKQEEVVRWFLAQIAGRGAQCLTIWTGVTQDQQHPGTRIDLAEKFAREISKISSDSEFNGTVNLYVFDAHLHDRYLHFRYSESGVAFALGAGVDVFRSEYPTEMTVANPISDIELKNILASSRLRPSSQYQFTRSGIKNLPEQIRLWVPESW